MKNLILILAALIASPVFAANYDCAGTEPFWSVRVRPSAIFYYPPDGTAGIALQITETRGASGTIDGAAFVVKTKETNLAVVSDSDCTDGMSDRTYTHAAIYQVGDRVLYGCCNKAE
jgi:uncharacterized membrane protein